MHLLNKNNYGSFSTINGELPPVDAFCSMTMYSLPERLLVANPINRYSIGDRTKEMGL